MHLNINRMAIKFYAVCFFLFLQGCVKALAQQALPVYDTLQIGGIRQVVSYTGSATQPVILFLHGGPGSSRMGQADQFSGELSRHFLVVQWDQREAGKTLALNRSSLPVTLEQMEADTHEMILALLKKFNQQKLFLAGESWGTVPGFKMAAAYPELLYAYLAFSPVINQLESERILIDTLKVATRSNKTARKELNAVHIPFENADQIFYSRKWMFHHDGVRFSEADTRAVRQYLKDWATVWLPVWNAVLRRNLFKTLPEINCPVYFFIGGQDLQTNHRIATAYYEQLKAPAKQLYAFPDAGHSVLTQKAPEVQQLIIEEILKRTALKAPAGQKE